jgi:hypothetical protein
MLPNLFSFHSAGRNDALLARIKFHPAKNPKVPDPPDRLKQTFPQKIPSNNDSPQNPQQNPQVPCPSQVYLRFESAINTLLLPVTRQRNRFCRDFREVLARAQGLEGDEEKLLATIDAAVKGIQKMSPKVGVVGISWGVHGDLDFTYILSDRI